MSEVGKTTTLGDVNTANDDTTRESNGQVFFDTFSTNGDRLDQDSNDLSEESDKPESDTAEGKESTSKHDNKHNEGQSNPKVRSRTDREPAVVSNEADATEILQPSTNDLYTDVASIDEWNEDYTSSHEGQKKWPVNGNQPSCKRSTM